MDAEGKKDYSRQQKGYAIIDSPFPRGGYLIVEVLQRDTEGNVLRMKDNVLSEQTTVPDAQKLLDQWEGYDRIGLVAQFEAWQNKQA